MRRATGRWSAAPGLGPALTSATYNAANQQTAFGGATQTFDLNGNLTSDGTLTYTWDARNRLASLGGGATASFQYDPLGRRTSKTINSTQTGFLYDGLNPVQELNGSTPTANLLTGLGIDEYLTRTDSTATRTYLTEVLSSTVALTDNTGTVQGSYTYEPFGGTSTTGSPGSNSFDYTGRENDETGLKYYRARYYSPTSQRFLSEDPIEFEGTDSNLYAYVGNRPVLATDPEGLAADIVLDAFLIGYDIGRLMTGGRKDLRENLTALGLDAVGLVVPFATALGPAYRVAKASKVSSNVLGVSARKLQSKFKHAADFGVEGPANRTNRSKFSAALNQHINSPDVKTVRGTYRGQDVIHYVNPSTGLNVIADSAGNFVSGWKLNPEQLRRIMSSGKLGGG